MASLQEGAPADAADCRVQAVTRTVGPRPYATPGAIALHAVWMRIATEAVPNRCTAPAVEEKPHDRPILSEWQPRMRLL